MFSRDSGRGNFYMNGQEMAVFLPSEAWNGFVLLSSENKMVDHLSKPSGAA